MKDGLGQALRNLTSLADVMSYVFLAVLGVSPVAQALPDKGFSTEPHHSLLSFDSMLRDTFFLLLALLFR